MANITQRRFLVLHGWQNRRPRGHWQRWLVAELRAAGEQVTYPQLPDPQTPQLLAWSELLHAELDLLDDAPHAVERVIVCHSLSCLLWLHYAQASRLTTPVDRVLLVAPPGPSAFVPQIASFAPCSFDPTTIAGSAHSPLRLVCSDNDPYCPEQAATLYGHRLNLATEVLPSAGHLDSHTGYGPWPAVLAWCLNPATTFTKLG